MSHGAIHWLGIRAGHSSYQPYGQKGLKPVAVLYCSSLGYDGIDWAQVSEALHGTIESWATAGSSPSEWETEHRRVPGVSKTFIVVSPYDLNEYFLCDVRADVVSLGSSIKDLRESNADWEFSMRIFHQYSRMYVRKFFPTIGRSDGVMVGIRAKLGSLVGGSSGVDAGDAPRLGSIGSPEVTEKVSDWSAGRLERRMVSMRNACLGKHSFKGPKALALNRLVKWTMGQGQITMLVMPVSPIYHKEFLSSRVTRDFEQAIVELGNHYPRMEIVRLDQISSLDDNNMFSDFVHLNTYGRQISTVTFLNQLKESVRP